MRKIFNKYKSSLEKTKKEKTHNTDQVLLDLVNGIRDLEERMLSLEQNYDSLASASVSADEDSILETQLHVARLSAELSRLTIELRGKISVLNNNMDFTFGEKSITPGLEGDESFEDLAADSPVRKPHGKTTSGWQPLN